MTSGRTLNSGATEIQKALLQDRTEHMQAPRSWGDELVTAHLAFKGEVLTPASQCCTSLDLIFMFFLIQLLLSNAFETRICSKSLWPWELRVSSTVRRGCLLSTVWDATGGRSAGNWQTTKYG